MHFNRRVLTIHGSDDEITPVRDAFRFHSTIANHELNIIGAAKHCFVEHRNELISAVLSYIGECLQQVLCNGLLLC